MGSTTLRTRSRRLFGMVLEAMLSVSVAIVTLLCLDDLRKIPKMTSDSTHDALTTSTSKLASYVPCAHATSCLETLSSNQTR